MAVSSEQQDNTVSRGEWHELEGGFLLHIFPRNEKWEVWLTTSSQDFGLCVGIDETKEKAQGDAFATLELGALKLRSLPRE